LRNVAADLRDDDEEDHEEEEKDEKEKPEKIYQRDAIWQVLPEAAERSRSGGYQFSQRSLIIESGF
jgi:hypothetical protein